MSTFKQFKDVIDTSLKQADLTQAHLARKLDYTPDRLNRWLLGVNRIPYVAVRKICTFLKLERSEEAQLFALAGYPLPDWVEQLLTYTQTETSVAATAEALFDPAILGKYAGESQEHHFSEQQQVIVPDSGNREQFTIAKLKDTTLVDGQSFDKKTESLASTWTGYLWKVEHKNILYFGIELNADIREIGTLILHCQSGTVTGWFYLGREHKRVIYHMFASKVASG